MLRAGSILAGRFHLVEQIGEGGMAVVWRARDQVLGADVAVKLLRPSLARDENARTRFRAEAMNTRRARNDHVVEIHELVLDATQPLFVMPLLSGCTLTERIRRTGGVDFAVAEPILVQLLRGLAVAHDQGIVHRDIKPHNIFLDRPPGSDAARVVLLDFGIAFDDQRDAALTQTGLVVGTPAYMAPEVSAGEPRADHPAADVYAAALVAYEMITGARPRAVPRPTPLHETKRGAEANIPSAFGRALDRALDPDPARRHQSARELLEELQSAPDEIASGDLIDARYRVVHRLGEGGMATIYRAEDTRLGGEVAIKMLADELSDDPELRGRFRDECEILMRMSHSHIVGVRAVGSHVERPYCVLDLVEGRSLTDAATDLGWAGSVRVIVQVAAALDDVHVAGVVHRDVKADNILIRPNGDAVLIDFGVARLGGAWRTRTGIVIGTPGAEAPEQVGGGHMSGLTDQWALAAVCYRLLANRAPGEAVDIADAEERALQTMENVALGHIAPLDELRPELPSGLCAAVMRGLASEPADRYRSASAFAAAVRNSGLAGLPGEATPQNNGRRWLAGAFAAIAAAGLIAMAIVLADGQSTEAETEPGHAAEVVDPEQAVDTDVESPTTTPEVTPATSRSKRAAVRATSRVRKAPKPKRAPSAAAPTPAAVPMPMPSLDPAAMMEDAERMADEFERAALDMDAPDDFPDDADMDWQLPADDGM